MFESGYVIPILAEHIAPSPLSYCNISDNQSCIPQSYSFIAKIVSQSISGATVSNETENIHLATFAVSPWHVWVIACIVLLWLLIPVLLQTIAVISKCKSHRNELSKPSNIGCLKYVLVLFLMFWVIVSAFLLFSVIYCSVNLNIVNTRSENGSSIMKHLDIVAVKFVHLLRVTVQSSMKSINRLIFGLKSDFSEIIIEEIPNVIDNFLKQTNLNQPLIVLANLSHVVEELLRTHTYLRTHGPRMTSELDKLESILYINGKFLYKELQKSKSLCSKFPTLQPHLDQFGKLVLKLADGLTIFNNSSRSYFQFFSLESSLGLFNMLNMLPFNVTEVIEQLRETMNTQRDLEESIIKKIKAILGFGQIANANFNDVTWLEPHFLSIFDLLNTSMQLSHDTFSSHQPIAEHILFAKILVFMFGCLSLSTPFGLLVFACCGGVWDKVIPREPLSKEIQPLITSSYTTEVRNSDVSTKVALDFTHLLTVNQTNQGLSAISTCNQTLLQPINDNLEIRTPNSIDTSLVKDKTDVRMTPKTRNPFLFPKRRFKGCTYCISCWSLFMFSCITIVLIVGTGYFHVQVCLPLANNEHRKLLDSEINVIIDSNWAKWISNIDEALMKMFSFYLNSSSSKINFKVSQFVHISHPRNIVSSVLNTCSPEKKIRTFDKMTNTLSLFEAMLITVKFNLTGLLDLPFIDDYTKQFKVKIANQAVQLLTNKLKAGILPQNFELLLKTLQEEEKSKNSASVLDTVEKFWSHSIMGATERHQAMTSVFLGFNQNHILLKRIMEKQLQLQEQADGFSTVSKVCTTSVTKLLQMSDYSLRLILSSENDYPFEMELEQLIAAANDLATISKLPTFSKTLSNFARMATKIGLSSSSPVSARQKMINNVKLVTENELNRLTGKLLSSITENILNKRVNHALSEFASPCSDFGRIAEAAISTICVTPTSNRNSFDPMLLRISALAFLMILFVITCQVFQVLYKSRSLLLRCPPSRRKKNDLKSF